ncbi:hypothetical protein M3Y97_00605900 [Aphelenchoides bicaudatus]|nr:hypothetical protein M3Y97_00605900 [Aphelenchoides bicaudatus]
MQIHEFYKCERSDAGLTCWEGRWHWSLKQERDDCGNYNIQVEWLDLYGKKDNVILTGTSPTYLNYAALLTSEVFLVHCQSGPEAGLRLLLLDWTEGTCKIASSPLDLHLLYHKPLVNRAGFRADRKLDLLMYKLEHTGNIHCFHFLIDRQLCQIKQQGAEFELSQNLFNCLDFNEQVISGLSMSLDSVTRYSLDSKQVVSSVQIQGLPPSTCLWEKTFKESMYNPRSIIQGLWSSKKLFIWSEEAKENFGAWTEHSLCRIYVVDLDTGVARQLPYVFDGKIRRITQTLDGILCVRVDRFLQSKALENIGGTMELRIRTDREYKYFRIANKAPEKLLLLCSISIPRPWPLTIKQLMEKRDDIPAQLYKC